MALKFYDVHSDEMREPTQADLDALMALQQAYGKVRVATEQAHAQLLVEIERIKRKDAQAANQLDFDTAAAEEPGEDDA